jgi:hypothetical protein
LLLKSLGLVLLERSFSTRAKKYGECAAEIQREGKKERERRAKAARLER